MLDSTPKSHQDYLSTFSLSRSTDMVIRVMTEVKIREDEYNLLKVFSSRIQGLPAGNSLATRERRLLYSGPLSLILDNIAMSSDISRESVDTKQKSDFKRTNRASKFMDAFNASGSVFEKPDSVNSATTNLAPPTSSTPAKSSWFSRLPLRKKSSPKMSAPSGDSTKDRNIAMSLPPVTLRSVPLHAFVFSDLVLLAHSCHTTGGKVDWILSQDLAFFNPLSIARLQDRDRGWYFLIGHFWENGFGHLILYSRRGDHISGGSRSGWQYSRRPY